MSDSVLLPTLPLGLRLSCSPGLCWYPWYQLLQKVVLMFEDCAAAWSHVDVVGHDATRGYTDVSGHFWHPRPWSGPTQQPRVRSYCNWHLCCCPWPIWPPKATLISMVQALLSRSMVLLQHRVVFMDCVVTRIWLEVHNPCSYWLWRARRLLFCDMYDCICTVERYIKGSMLGSISIICPKVIDKNDEDKFHNKTT